MNAEWTIPRSHFYHCCFTFVFGDVLRMREQMLHLFSYFRDDVRILYVPNVKSALKSKELKQILFHTETGK